jgi:crotonobetainyl-CoA:carnitine CoA-transferase CaiB-like acyl-CoA transferase
MAKVLQKYRVLDLSRVLAGPYCAQLLADQGAQVIKVENPGTGDENRVWGTRAADGITSNFHSVNRGKLGITLNLKAPAGRALLERLLVKTDIVIHSFLPESAARLGLSFSDVKVVNPEIIYCSINGYGPQGELHNKAGYDLMMQAYSGIMSTTGYPDGPPVRAGVSFIDMTTGIVAYGGVMTALVKRLQGGGGSKVTASLLETAISLLGYHAVTWLQAGQLPTKEGSGVFHLVPYQAFQCQDGYLLVGATNDLAWQRFCVALGHADLAMDARFKTNDKRLAHRSVLVGVIEGILATAPVASWLVRFDVQGVAAAPINTLDQVLVDPQVLANHMVTAVVNADGQSLPVLGVPFKLSGDHSVANNSAPQLGADTDAVLRDELQISANEIEVLRAQGVI